MMNNPVDLSIVVPVYNSSKIIPELVSRIQKALGSTPLAYELILTNDCSPDNSWQVIKEICRNNRQITGLRLGKNCGQWCSTLAGMSRASGKFIITIDDDLEYNPEDILKLHEAITTNNFRVVFGMAKEKYFQQGKNNLSQWRKGLLRIFWNTAPTDSFKILVRELVFDGGKFLPEVLLDAFIEHNLDKKYWGYCQVSFNKRYAGNSNHSFFKKIKLFFLYSFHYLHSPSKYVSREPPYFIVEEIKMNG